MWLLAWKTHYQQKFVIKVFKEEGTQSLITTLSSGKNRVLFCAFTIPVHPVAFILSGETVLPRHRTNHTPGIWNTHNKTFSPADLRVTSLISERHVKYCACHILQAVKSIIKFVLVINSTCVKLIYNFYLSFAPGRVTYCRSVL